MRQLRTSDTPHPATKFLYVSETVLADAAGVCAALFARCEPLSNSRSVLEVALLAKPRSHTRDQVLGWHAEVYKRAAGHQNPTRGSGVERAPLQGRCAPLEERMNAPSGCPEI